MSSELTFSATEYIRSQILAKNLEGSPFGGVAQEFTPTGTILINQGGVEKPGKVIVSQMRDMSVVDLPSSEYMNEFFIDQIFLANKYGPVGGYDDMTDINTIILDTTNAGIYTTSFEAPEGGGITSHNSIGQLYTPGQILLGVSAEGLLTNANLIDDSLLQQIGAIQLKKEFQYRIGQELEQQTIGRINLLEGFKDPYTAIDILRGDQSMIERDWQITVPKSLIGKGLDFISRLTGVGLPFSYIPGDYFELEPPRGLSMGGKIISDITGILGSLIGIPRRRQSPSQRFLEFTGGGTKSQLFKHIRYNKYGPQYGEGAQAQTAIGAVFGEVIDFVGGGILGAGNYPPNPPQYVGSNRNKVSDMTSPPDNNYAGENYVPVYGPDEVAKDFDNNDYRFGLKGKALINKGTVEGGFTWYGSVAGTVPGTTQGPEGSTDGTKIYTDKEIPPQYNATKSTNYDFVEGSIMNATQQIIESVPNVGGKRLKHVGHAINQSSKVFNDGYKELTKGSRVRRYENTDATSGRGVEVAKEYCRLWTKDIPYWTYGRLQKTEMNHRKETYSVLDSPFNLNIAPWRTNEGGSGSSNIVNGKAKKYMFSLENLAWRTSREKGFTYDDLPACEKGSNGGRVMWFPPYDLQVDEASTANWTTNNFLGRPEPIYSYNNTDRTGTLRFKIVVDHASVLNMLVRRELKKLTDEEVNGIVDSFHAGCKKYDIYDLARKWNLGITVIQEIETIINSADVDQATISEISDGTNTSDPQIIEDVYDSGPLIAFASPSLSFYFENDSPDPNTRLLKSSSPYNALADVYYSESNQQNYQDQQPNASLKQGLNSFFNEATSQCCEEADRFHQFMTEANNALKDGKNRVTLTFVGGASNLAPSGYNVNLSQRRLDSVRQMVQNYTLAGEQPFISYLEKGFLIFPEGDALGESECVQSVSDDAGDRAASVYNAAAANCRFVALVGIDVEAIPGEEDTESYTTPPTATGFRYDRPDPTPPIVKKRTQKQMNTRREIANKVLREMVTECDYFDMLKEEDPFIFDSLKDKFKYFHPAFHAITPEGLNSRLTFLNQCLRPGSTIPTKKGNGELDYNTDAKNTSFGAPPVCVLRIGDFYHTKIIIQNLSISYDDNLLDFNPEGIGVQPMIASVNLTFNYVGGQGLKGPVERLQNALSFNFYGNTEVYDPRAVYTVTDDDPDEQTWLQENQDLINQVGANLEEEAAKEEDMNTSANDGQTIGDRTTVQTTTSGETGFISFKSVFNDYTKQNGVYITGTLSELQLLMTNRNYGLLQLVMSERQWTEGAYFYPTTPGSLTSVPGNLLGQPVEVSTRINALYDWCENEIDNDNTYIQRKHDVEAFPTNARKRKLRRLLKQKLEESRDSITNELEEIATNLGEKVVELSPFIQRLNTVANSCDGYVDSGKPVSFALTGLTEVHSSSAQQTPPPTDTLQELGNDYLYMINTMNYYVDSLNGDAGVACTVNELPCENASSSLSSSESGSLTKLGKYVSPNSFEVAPGGTLDPTTMSVEYLIFSQEIIDKDVVDMESTENFYYYQDVFSLNNTTGTLWTDIYEKLNMDTDEEWWVNARKTLSLAFVKNENYYLKNLQAITKQVKERFVSEEGTITEGLTTAGDNLTTQFISEDKDRKTYYEKLPAYVGSICDNSLLTLSYQTNNPDNNFNWKFNRE
jgi:hypothetical protein|tara:strand:- start:13515 stop:18536 length:5022 start_codon:yes stop_codon:yes gene_type:complete